MTQEGNKTKQKYRKKGKQGKRGRKRKVTKTEYIKKKKMLLKGYMN